MWVDFDILKKINLKKYFRKRISTGVSEDCSKKRWSLSKHEVTDDILTDMGLGLLASESDSNHSWPTPTPPVTLPVVSVPPSAPIPQRDIYDPANISEPELPDDYFVFKRRKIDKDEDSAGKKIPLTWANNNRHKNGMLCNVSGLRAAIGIFIFHNTFS